MKTVSFAMIPLILAMSNPAPIADKPRPAVRAAPAPVTAKPRPAVTQQTGKLTLKTYKVHFTDLQQLTEVIPLMMPDANGLSLKTVDKNLVVRGTPEQHKVVQQMLLELDAPPKNIQVNVRFGTSGGSYNKEIGIRPKGPLAINQDSVHGSLQGQFRNQSTTLNENTTQMLVAMDGRSASLRVGGRVPYIAWLTEYGHRHGYVQNIDIEWRDVGSFLAVEPSIIGPGLIRVRLIPELSGRLKNGDPHRIQFTHLATEVTVRDGQTISIGGFSKDNNFSSKFLIGRGSSGESSVTDITLTPRIL